MTRIGIRADANEVIATGHVMRCLSIADALRKMGEEPLFITADDFPKAWIEQRGYSCTSLQSDWKHMDGELERLEQAIKGYGIKVLLVDSYFATKTYFEMLHDRVKTIYIDDLGKEAFNVDAVICYAGYYRELTLEEKYSSQVKSLLGMDYTPLRTVFSELPSKKILPEIKELIVLSGGTDKYGFLEAFSKALLKKPLLEKVETVHIICGRYYGKYHELTQEFQGIEKLQFHKGVNDIEKYMLSADAAISAAGVTSYELCAVGVPSIIYTMADNQLRNAMFFHESGLMEYAGDLRYDPVLERILELLEGKYQRREYRRKASEAMKYAVDGKGVWRIAQLLREIK